MCPGFQARVEKQGREFSRRLLETKAKALHWGEGALCILGLTGSFVPIHQRACRKPKEELGRDRNQSHLPHPYLLPGSPSILSLMVFNFTPDKHKDFRGQRLCLLFLCIPLKSLLSAWLSHSKGTMNVCFYDLPPIRKIKAMCQA